MMCKHNFNDDDDDDDNLMVPMTKKRTYILTHI